MLIWLFPAALVLAGAQHRRVDRGYVVAAAAETVFVAAVLHVATPEWARVLVATALALYALFFAIDRRILQTTGFPLDASLVALAVRDPEGFATTFRTWFGTRGWLTFAALSGLALVGALVATSGNALPVRVVVAVMVGALAVLGWATVHPGSLPPVPNLVRAVAMALRRRLRSPSGLVGPGAAHRMPVPVARSGSPPCDVLIVLCESLSGTILTSSAGVAATPRLHGFRADRAGGLVAMENAMCNSTLSDVSYPSILTGLSPERSHADFHHAPLLWNAAKARGYRTAFFSAQSLTWCNLGRFLIDDSLDRSVYRETLNAAAVNDLGMDDRILNRIVCADLAEASSPSFTVVNHNMLHLPGLADARTVGDDPDRRYLAALRLFDRCFGELIDTLDHAGRLDRTAIFLVADHGELPSRPGLRLYDLTDDLLAVPFWVSLPPGAVDDKARQELVTNAALPVANVDLVPTVLQLIGIDPDIMPIRLSGHSLLRPLPSDRTLVAVNNGALRRWDRTPFAVTWKGERIIFHDRHDRHDRPAEGDRPALGAEWLAHLLDLPVVGAIVASRGLVPGVVAAPGGIAAEYDELARLGERAELHKLDNWRGFELADWKEHCRRTIEWIGVSDGDRVFESGCGAGAFLQELRANRRVTVAGVDLSSGLVAIARSRVPGEFWVGDVQDLSVVPSASQDLAVSHAVFVYMATREVAERAATEMVRIVRPGGQVYIGVLNDPDRRAATPPRDGPSGNWILPRRFWTDLAARLGVGIRIADQESIYAKATGYDAHARLRYSVCLRVG